MPLVDSNIAEAQGLLEAARMMMISARTAPKAGGKDDVETLLVYGAEKDEIADEMERIGKERRIPGFMRDGDNVRKSEAVVLVGVDGSKEFGLNCGACGYETCTKFKSRARGKGVDFTGPTCIMKALDMGIALGSAVKVAGTLNIDNRIMYRIGTAALRLGLLKKSTVAMGIPISAKGKNIYFDRK